MGTLFTISIDKLPCCALTIGQSLPSNKCLMICKSDLTDAISNVACCYGYVPNGNVLGTN